MSALAPLPLPNDPSTRTADGTLKDQAAPPTKTETGTEASSTEKDSTKDTSTTDGSTNKDGQSQTETADKPAPSLLNADDKAEAKPEAKAPDAYQPFKVPDGYELIPEVATEASTIFKELGLNQDQAQKLVDFYSKQVQSVVEATSTSADTTWNTMNKEWQDRTMADPELGPQIGKVKETISRALDAVGDSALTKEFKSVMDLTGAGNHPAFVKAFYKLASAVTEGRHVGGTGPSKFGQLAPGASAKPSPAQALYPNNPTSATG